VSTPPTLAEVPAVLGRVMGEVLAGGVQRLLIPTLLADAASAHGDRILVRCESDTLTYAQADARANQVASAVRAAGLGPGTQVALMAGNSIPWLTTWFGLVRAGVTVVPVAPGAKGVDLAYLLSHSEARLVLCDRECLPALDAARSEVAGRYDVDTDLAGLGAGEPTGPPGGDPLPPEHPVEIMYTSGTTGPPKGVVIPLASLGPPAPAVAALLGLSGDDVLYTCMPLFHLNAQAITTVCALALGAQVALAPRFSASRFWRDLVRYGATEFNYIGGMPGILLNTPAVPDEREHRARLCFGAAMPKDMWVPFEERFGVEVIEFYGQIEGGFLYNGPDGKVGSMGRPVAGMGEVRVVDPASGEQLGAGEVGELWARPANAAGPLVRFWRNEEEQAARTAGGWLHTGDLVSYDSDGFYYFVDRSKDALRRRGENISTWSVETAVAAHPAVLECAAYGVPADLGEDDVKVDVVLVPGGQLDPAELVTWCEERLVAAAVPRYVQVRDALPKTGTERVQKARLRAEGTAAAWDRQVAAGV